MPVRAKRPCAYNGCSELVQPPERYCPNHKQEAGRAERNERGKTAERGYGWRHQKLRKMVLAEEPLCRECLKIGKVTPSTQMDHIDGNPFNVTRENLQGLCARCHNIKTKRGNR